MCVQSINESNHTCESSSKEKQYLCPGLSCCDPKYLSKALAPEAHMEDGERRREDGEGEGGQGNGSLIGLSVRRFDGVVAWSPRRLS